MSRITLVRGAEEMPGEPVLAGVRRFLFGLFDGWTKDDKRMWRRLWKLLMSLEPGEFALIEFIFPRNPKYHRKFFALLNYAFEAWEPDRQRKTYKGRPVQKNFERFRKDVLIQAGFYDQTFDLNGNMELEAQSISFAKMDDAEFERVYSAVVDVILEQVLSSYSGRDELEAVVNQVMGLVG